MCYQVRTYPGPIGVSPILIILLPPTLDEESKEDVEEESGLEVEHSSESQPEHG